MCDLAAASLALGVGSAIIGGVGQVQAGNAARAQANYQAQVARNNEMAAEYMARDAEARGRLDQQEARRRTSLALGTQRAALAAQGGDVASGSALDILDDTIRTGEMDALMIQSNAAREAYGYRVQGSNFSAEANAASARARQAQRAGYVGAGATLLGGAASTGANWVRFRNMGVW